MRWLASGFFFAVALGLVFLAGVALIQPWGSGDTAASVVRGEGVFFLVIAAGSVLGGFWVLRHWSDRSS